MNWELDKFEWLDHDSSWDACITYIEPAKVEDIVSLLQCTNGPLMLNYDSVGKLQDFNDSLYHVQIQPFGQAVILVEPIGFVGQSDPVPTLLSQNSKRLVSIYWNVEALMRFVLAENGVVIRAFDALCYGLDSEVGSPIALEGELPFGQVKNSHRALLALFEQLTGFTPTPKWLYHEKRPTYRIGVSIDS
ncbi:MAG: hypothetical protein HKL80_11305 [Acidimicrobiales bacterium]|nr:hypothetical protein [Acidimicrobiales bacterium]